MIEMGASEKNAREYIRHLVDELWKKLNEFEDEKLVSSSQTFVEMSKNLARIAQCMYQYGNEGTIDQNKAKEQIMSFLVHPIIIH